MFSLQQHSPPPALYQQSAISLTPLLRILQMCRSLDSYSIAPCLEMIILWITLKYLFMLKLYLVICLAVLLDDNSTSA